jgi:predicted aspartyl protease
MKQVFFALACLLFLSSCDSLKTLKLIKNGAIQKGNFTNKTTFERVSNLMVVKIFIKEKPYNFVFDTGAGMTVISEKLAKELGLKPKSKMSIGDSQGKENKVNLYAIESLSIANTTFTNEICLASDFTKMSTMGENIDGILGATVMRKAVWYVDNAQQVISVSNDINTLPKLDNALKLPFKSKGFDFTPSVTVLLAGVPYVVGFDSGSSNGVSLNKKLMTSAQNQADLMQAAFSVGNSSTGLYGRGKVDTTYYLKTAKMQFAGAAITNEQVVRVRRNTSSLIGMKILKNYNFTVDWQTKEILLSPIKEVPKDTLNPWGFGTVFEDNSLKITEIRNNSDAAKKGLMLEDIVLKINENSYQNLSKKEQYAIFLGDLIPTESTEVHLVVLRNKEEIKIDLKK